jgi:hypothetical protein
MPFAISSSSSTIKTLGIANELFMLLPGGWVEAW